MARQYVRATEQAVWVTRWVGSGLSHTEFASKHGLSASALRPWGRRRREEDYTPPVRFVEVAVGAEPGRAARTAHLRLEVGSHIALVFDELPAAEYLAAVVRAVG